MAGRLCHKCQRSLPRARFSRLADGSHRFYSWCDDCRANKSGSRVYVVRLSDEIGPRKVAAYPNVYLGRSALPPEDRFFQHKEGVKKGKGYVFRYGEWLMFRLFRALPTYKYTDDVLKAEAVRARELAAKGYTVWGGH
jgi:hypothetical protein